MTEDDLKQRTKAFSLRVLKLVDSLPDTNVLNVIDFSHREGREARRGDPAGLLPPSPRLRRTRRLRLLPDPRNDSLFIKGRWYDTRSGRILANQLGRSGTSVGANYRAACRSRSTAEMISRLSVVEEEADESAFWMELISDHGLEKPAMVAPLLKEAGELTAIMVASRRTLAKRNPKSKIQN